MSVALFNLEPRIENTAMMQVSKFHKDRGDKVVPYSPLFHSEYNRIYAFSIFAYTSKRAVTSDMICGGTGFNIRSRLPPEIESCDLDYSMFPKCRTSYLWFSRGCIRKCPFCCVPEKEGGIHPVVPKNLNPNGKFITIMDNNFFANPYYHDAITDLVKLGQPVEFHGGIDVRIFDDEQGRSLQRLTLHKEKQLYVAMDDPKEKHRILSGIEYLANYVPRSRIACYVLIGYWSTPEEDLDRVQSLRELKVDPFVMPFNKRDPYQMAFARWVNGHVKGEWENYEHGPWKAVSNQPVSNHIPRGGL